MVRLASGVGRCVFLLLLVGVVARPPAVPVLALVKDATTSRSTDEFMLTSGSRRLHANSTRDDSTDDLVDALVGNATGGFVFWTLTQYCRVVPSDLKNAHSNPLSLMLTISAAPVLFGWCVMVYGVLKARLRKAVDRQVSKGLAGDKGAGTSNTKDDSDADSGDEEKGLEKKDDADPATDALYLLSRQQQVVNDFVSLTEDSESQLQGYALTRIAGVTKDHSYRAATIRKQAEALAEEQKKLAALIQTQKRREGEAAAGVGDAKAENGDNNDEKDKQEVKQSKADAEVRPIVFAALQLVVPLHGLILYAMLFMGVEGSLLCYLAFWVATPTFKPIAPAMWAVLMAVANLAQAIRAGDDVREGGNAMPLNPFTAVLMAVMALLLVLWTLAASAFLPLIVLFLPASIMLCCCFPLCGVRVPLGILQAISKKLKLEADADAQREQQDLKLKVTVAQIFFGMVMLSGVGGV